MAAGRPAERRLQWEFAALGKGWTVKNVASGLYLTIEKGIGAGVPIVASEYPVAWNVQIEHDDPGLVRSVGPLVPQFHAVTVSTRRISWPGSEAVWDLRDGRGGTPVRTPDNSPTNRDLQRVARRSSLEIDTRRINQTANSGG